MDINSENNGKVTEEGKFLSAACRKGLGSNSILCQFCRCWEHKRCSDVRGALKEDGKFKCQNCTNQQTDMAEGCPGIEFNDHSLKIAEKFFLSS